MAIESTWLWILEYIMGSRQRLVNLTIISRPHLMTNGYIAQIYTLTMARSTREPYNINTAGAVVGN